jgi:formate hydrogenlyase subunit 3/multisubunit Na+/H+ antiporter MnhD subunit
MGMIGRISGNAFLSLAGFTGAILHVFNHFTFKSLLFYAAGAIYSQTHTRNIEKLGGLQHAMPVTAAPFSSCPLWRSAVCRR